MLYSVKLNLSLILVIALCSSLPDIARYQRQGDPFLHILSFLDKALIEKQMLVHVGSFCTTNLPSGTALQ